MVFSACRHSNLPSAGFLVFSFSMLQLKSPYFNKTGNVLQRNIEAPSRIITGVEEQ
jgi:hypothetical protein